MKFSYYKLIVSIISLLTLVVITGCDNNGNQEINTKNLSWESGVKLTSISGLHELTLSEVDYDSETNSYVPTGNKSTKIIDFSQFDNLSYDTKQLVLKSLENIRLYYDKYDKVDSEGNFLSTNYSLYFFEKNDDGYLEYYSSPIYGWSNFEEEKILVYQGFFKIKGYVDMSYFGQFNIDSEPLYNYESYINTLSDFSFDFDKNIYSFEFYETPENLDKGLSRLYYLDSVLELSPYLLNNEEAHYFRNSLSYTYDMNNLEEGIELSNLNNPFILKVSTNDPMIVLYHTNTIFINNVEFYCKENCTTKVYDSDIIYSSNYYNGFITSNKDKFEDKVLSKCDEISQLLGLCEVK